MKVICLSGYARHGKDTAATFLKESLEDRGNRVLIAHYADLLKYICKTFFSWNGQKDDAGRTLLQYVGTDVVRKKKPNFWVGFITDILTLFNNEWDYVIISDTRFPDEVTYLKDAGLDTIHIRVRRENFVSPLTKEQQNHPSETALDNTEPDIVVINNTIDEFKASMHAIAEVLMNE